MKTIGIALSAALALSCVASADIIDQLQDEATAYMAAFSQGDLAQSFQTQAYDHISGAGIHLYTNGSPGDITIQLWDLLPPDGGTMMAEGVAYGTPGEWVDVFWDPVNIEPFTTYYLVFEADTGGGIYGSTSDPYEYGMVFANPGYNPFPSFDYTFRTWVVPTPGALALLGLAGLAGRRRR
jgi:hypothetical protein